MAAPDTGSAFIYHSEDEENEHRTKNGAYPAHGSMHSESTGDKVADIGTRHAKKRGENDAAPIIAGHEELGDGANDESNEECDNQIHAFSLAVMCRPGFDMLPGQPLRLLAFLEILDRRLDAGTHILGGIMEFLVGAAIKRVVDRFLHFIGGGLGLLFAGGEREHKGQYKQQSVNLHRNFLLEFSVRHVGVRDIP
jgi:hypothetical protein